MSDDARIDELVGRLSKAEAELAVLKDSCAKCAATMPKRGWFAKPEEARDWLRLIIYGIVALPLLFGALAGVKATLFGSGDAAQLKALQDQNAAVIQLLSRPEIQALLNPQKVIESTPEPKDERP